MPPVGDVIPIMEVAATTNGVRQHLHGTPPRAASSSTISNSDHSGNVDSIVIYVFLVDKRDAFHKLILFSLMGLLPTCCKSQ